MSLTKEQYRNLIVRQRELNDIINPEWKADRTLFDFQIAMTVEANECIEHCAYKWWKKEEVDVKQAQMEVVDCWFFYLSAMIIADYAGYAEENMLLLSGYEPQDFDQDATILASMRFINWVSFEIYACDTTEVTSRLWDMTKAVGLTVEQMYEMYMAKLVLNIFRQKHGYSDGTYMKVWNGIEDNEVLHELMKRTVDLNELDDMLETLYSAAFIKYQLQRNKNGYYNNR